HEQPSDISIGSHFDVDLTSVADTTITTKYGSPVRRQTNSQQHVVAVRRRKGKQAFPKSSILKMKIEFPVLASDPAPRFGYAMPEVLPTTVIIDPAGGVSKVLVGPQTEASILAEMEAE
ncbi:MAG: TlpA family protein disulfide reductase, partial [Pseudomonadales bacterium]